MGEVVEITNDISVELRRESVILSVNGAFADQGEGYACIEIDRDQLSDLRDAINVALADGEGS